MHFHSVIYADLRAASTSFCKFANSARMLSDEKLRDCLVVELEWPGSDTVFSIFSSPMIDDKDGRKLSILLRLDSRPLLGGGIGGGCKAPMLCRLIEADELRDGGAGGLSAEERRLDTAS